MVGQYISRSAYTMSVIIQSVFHSISVLAAQQLTA